MGKNNSWPFSRQAVFVMHHGQEKESFSMQPTIVLRSAIMSLVFGLLTDDPYMQ